MNRKSITKHSSVGNHPDRLSHPAPASGRIGHAAEPSDSQADGFSHILRALLLPIAASAVTGLGAVTVLTAIAGAGPDPGAIIPVLSVVALVIASLAGGITAGLCRRDRAIPTALVSGCLLTVILCAISLMGGGSRSATWSEVSPVVPWLIRLAPLPIHALGGLLVRPRPQKAAHTAPRRR